MGGIGGAMTRDAFKYSQVWPQTPYPLTCNAHILRGGQTPYEFEFDSKDTVA